MSGKTKTILIPLSILAIGCAVLTAVVVLVLRYHPNPEHVVSGTVPESETVPTERSWATSTPWPETARSTSDALVSAMRIYIAEPTATDYRRLDSDQVQQSIVHALDLSQIQVTATSSLHVIRIGMWAITFSVDGSGYYLDSEGYAHPDPAYLDEFGLRLEHRMPKPYEGVVIRADQSTAVLVRDGDACPDAIQQAGKNAVSAVVLMEPLTFEDIRSGIAAITGTDVIACSQ